jgi:predicted phage terminase large subunit-like protein
MDLNFTLHAKQREVFVSKARQKVCAAGRRAGKSYLSVVTLLIQGLKSENRFGTPLTSMAEVWYVAPTYQQGRDIVWNMLKELGGWGTPSSVIHQVHENTSTMTLINGRVIKIKGSDRPDTLRGNSLSYVVMDEYAFMKPEVWDMIIQPSLADLRGEALFIGTPSGKNHFYDLWLEASDPANIEMASFHFNSLDNPMISPEEIAMARQRMSVDAFRQEFEASFEASGGGAFKADEFIFADAPVTSGTIYVTVDPAGFGKTDGMIKSNLKKLDECAIAVVEVGSEGWFVHDVISGRWGVRETSLQIIRAAQKYKAAVVGIEKGALKNAIIPYLEDQMRRLNSYPRIEEVTHGGQKKTERILWALQGRFQNGRIVMKKGQEWNKKLTDQLLDFPNPLAHDDLPDALAYIDQISAAIYDHGWVESTYEPLDSWSGY